MSASIQIKGVDELIAKLGKVVGVDVLVAPMQRAVRRLQYDMKEYPPQPPRSSYRRTGTLGRKWTVRVTRLANGLRGKVRNKTWYAPLVQHDRRFARPHQTLQHQSTGWITDAQAMDRNEKAIAADFEATIQRAMA
jgi:hypothetical protein